VVAEADSVLSEDGEVMLNGNTTIEYQGRQLSAEMMPSSTSMTISLIPARAFTNWTSTAIALPGQQTLWQDWKMDTSR